MSKMYGEWQDFEFDQDGSLAKSLDDLACTPDYIQIDGPGEAGGIFVPLSVNDAREIAEKWLWPGYRMVPGPHGYKMVQPTILDS